MIDIEQAVFNLVSNAVALVPNILVLGEYVDKPSSFPCVMCTEISSQSYKKTQDDVSMENHILVGYQMDIYTKGSNKKDLAKQIAKAIDTEMLAKKFNRDLYQRISNEQDDQIYRIVLRYSAVASKDFRIYST